MVNLSGRGDKDIPTVARIDGISIEVDIMARLSARLNEIKRIWTESFGRLPGSRDPNPKITVPLMHQMVDAGVDVFELGMPFSDPEAEGPIIQLAHERALTHKISLTSCLDMVREFREDNSITPVVLMGYLNQ